ncbi:MAG: hypothetical protein K0S41_164 [Anaerocolumna sp.]|jgi:hypothetical protein|nr:hypothetical protein [Anaerocolumna sp.]
MIATGTLLVALSRIIKEVFVQFKKLNSYISNTIIVLLILIFLNLIYMGFTNTGNEHSKKLFKIALLLVVLSVVPLGVWILVELFI